MIYGIGMDMVDISRLSKIYKKFGYRFLKKVYTQNEIDKALEFNSQEKSTAYLAKRFAAKEAFAKALGTGIGKNLSFNDIEILNDQYNKPYINLSKKLRNFLSNQIKNYKIHIALTDEISMASAMIIIETL